MASQKYYERLLLVAVIFFVFFVITFLGMPLVLRGLHLSHDTRNGLLIMSVLQAIFMFIAPSFVSARLISKTPVVYLQLKKAPGWLPVLGVIFAYLIALPVLNQIIYWNENVEFPAQFTNLWQTFKELEDAANKSTFTMLNISSLGALIVNLAVVALLTAFAEEIFFRGTLQHTATASGAPHIAIWIVAFLFSAMHFQIFGFIPRLLMGAWFGYLLYWTRSLYVPILAHFINNAVVVICKWLNFNGIDYDFEKFGVVESGFPYPAAVSALSLFIFLFCFRNYFFKHSTYNKEPQISESWQ